MNKIFKIIWSKARNCYVVVSEIAHCQGKGQKRAVLTCSLAAALTVFTLTGGITAVQAAQNINITEENLGAQDSSTNKGKYSTVISPGAKNESNQSDGVIVIGHSATVSNNGSPKDSIAIGTSANVVGENNIAIGTKAAVTNNGGNNAISLGTEAQAEKSESIAIGMKAQANNNDGIAAIAIGSGSEAQKDKSIAIGYKTLAENNGESGGIAIGSSIVDSQGTIIAQTKAAQGNDIAFGVGAQTNNRNTNGHNGGAIAIGHLSYSNGNQDVAIGDNAKTGRIGTEGEGYVAIGANSFSNVGPGVVGYDFQTNGAHNIQTNEYAAAWKSTNGAVSVGNVSDSDHTKWITRQITGVAAGFADTDAVNVAQLKTVKTLAGQYTTVEAGSENITVTEGTNSTGGKKYTVDLAKDVTFGDAAKGDKTVAISGTDGTITADTSDNKITVDGSKGQIVAGGDNGIKIGNIKNGDSSLTIYDKDGKATDKKADGGKFVTNLDNKTWKNDGSYVSGRAATEDQLHQVESNVNKKFDDVNTKIENVDKHHTEVTVNGGTAAPIAENTYSEGNLQIAQKTGDDGQKVYDLKLSDSLNIGGAGKDGKDGQNGHMGINGADGKSGIGIDGKDGISIKGKDGKDGVTIKGIDGKNGTEGHIGLTGSAGKDGQNASADIHVKNGQVGY